MLRKNVFKLALLGGLSLSTVTYAQSPVGDVLRGAVDGATAGAAQRANQAVNDALGVPNNPPVNSGIGANQTGQFGTNTQIQGQPLQGNAQLSTRQQLQAAGQQFSNQFRQNLSNSINADPNGYRINGQLDSELRNYGLQQGDIVLDRNGQPIRTSDGLNQWMQNSQGTILVQRNGQVVQLSGNNSASSNMQANSSGQPRRLGVVMQPDANNVIITSVDRNSLAAKSGLQAGDRIVSVNGQSINNPNMLGQRINAINGNEATLVVERNGQRETIVVRLDNRQQNRSAQQQWGQSGSTSQQSDSQLMERISELEAEVENLKNTVNQLTARTSVEGDNDAVTVEADAGNSDANSDQSDSE